MHLMPTLTSNNEELINFDKQKRLTNVNLFCSVKPLREAFLDDNSNYLKACNLLDLNLTTTTIIYPFHSFL